MFDDEERLVPGHLVSAGNAFGCSVNLVDAGGLGGNIAAAHGVLAVADTASKAPGALAAAYRARRSGGGEIVGHGPTHGLTKPW